MSKRKAVYGDHRKAEWSQPLEFSKEQLAVLDDICAVEGFSDGVRKIAERYRARIDMQPHSTTPADAIATIVDLGVTIDDVLNKLAQLPREVAAHLSDQTQLIRRLLSDLSALRNGIEFAKQKMPQPKTNVQKNGPELAAAHEVQRHFAPFKLTFSPKKPTKKLWPAGECLRLVFGGGENGYSDNQLASLIKEAKKG